MRLLKKQEVEQAKALEHAKAVNEGLGIARRVDALRETQANEEASLTELRTKTVSAMYEEVEGLTKKRDLLTDEITGLEERKIAALVPLDAEWEVVRLETEAIAESHRSIEQERSALEGDKIALSTARAVYETDARLLSEGHEEIAALLEKADGIEAEAITSRTDAQRTLTEAQEYRKLTEKELGDRELGIQAAEERQEKRDQEQDLRERDLNHREALLNDKERLLERDSKRLKT